MVLDDPRQRIEVRQRADEQRVLRERCVERHDFEEVGAAARDRTEGCEGCDWYYGCERCSAMGADRPLGGGLLNQALPELPVDDAAAAVRYYRDVLGFTVNYEQEDLGVLDRDDIRVLLLLRTPEHSGIGSAYIYVRDVDALHRELVQSGADVQGEPVSQPWGLREFVVRDIARNRLTFGQPIE
jgi:catechol 2,3-dioxygenase-like lactoylglutathione lyase family enzyme